MEAYSVLRSWMKMSSSHCLEPNAWRNTAGRALFRACGCSMHEETTALQSMKFTFMLAHGNLQMTKRASSAGLCEAAREASRNGFCNGARDYSIYDSNQRHIQRAHKSEIFAIMTTWLRGSWGSKQARHSRRK